MSIKKLIPAFLIMAIVFNNNLRAQNTSTNSVALSVGYGFPSLTKTAFNIANGDNVKSYYVGPLYGKAEFALSETVGFGIDFAYARGSATYQTQDNEIDSLFYNTNFTYTSYSALARVNFHFGHSDNFDPYTGVGLGYRNANYKYTGGDPDATPSEVNGFNHFGMDFTIGGRYYITENIAIYGELGIAKSPIQVGLVVKL